MERADLKFHPAGFPPTRSHSERSGGSFSDWSAVEEPRRLPDWYSFASGCQECLPVMRRGPSTSLRMTASADLLPLTRLPRSVPAFCLPNLSCRNSGCLLRQTGERVLANYFPDGLLDDLCELCVCDLIGLCRKTNRRLAIERREECATD